MNQSRIYGAVACVAALAAVGCGGSPSSNPSLPTAGAMRDLLGRPSSGRITEYVIQGDKPRPKTFPIGITTGPDKALWIAERGLGKLGRMTTDGNLTDQFKIKGKARFPQFVATGSDGNLWATVGSIHTYGKEAHGVPDPYGAVIGMTPAGHVFQVFELPMYSDPRGITSGPDGNIWFGEPRGAIGRITIGATSGDTLTEFPTPNNGGAFGIAVGPDGALWFSEPYGNKRFPRIGRITTSGVIKTFRFPKGSHPAHMVAGPNDGYLYVTERFADKVAQVTTGDKGGKIVREFPFPAGSQPEGINLGADNNLYVTEFNGGKIAQVALPSGAVTEFDIPTPNSIPWDIIGGSDGNIWFTESATGKIGMLALPTKR